jgi:hypothetical protein
MKFKIPNLLTMAALMCTLFFSSCQRETGIMPQDSGTTGARIPIDPLDDGILIPLAGNAFITKPVSGGKEIITSTGLSNWTNSGAITSTYFRAGQAGELFIAINASVPSGNSTIKVIVNGKEFTVLGMSGNTNKKYIVGLINITRPGYVKVDLLGITNTSNGTFANVSDIVVYGSATTSGLSFANVAANYTASRAGAGISLNYITNGHNAEWFYNEISVPTGSDIAGTNFVSNGFTGGSAGLQTTVNGEKRIVFYVSNYKTDETKLVRKGAGTTVDAGVTTGKSIYMPFGWQANTSYKFITQSKADALGNTTFSAWVFTPEDNEWKVIGSCSRTNSGSFQTGLYSKLQGMNADNGYAGRRMRSYNQWIYSNGNWTEVTSATFNGDAIAESKQRLDYSASADYSAYHLKSQGFFSDNLPLNTNLNRLPTTNQPTVDLVSLP